MTNLFRSATNRSATLILFVWPLAIGLALLALILMYEDYETSRLGYLALPTLKANSGIITFAVAALPQVGQIVLFYMFARNTNQRWTILIAGFLFLADIGTDTWFKMGGNYWLLPIAFIESLFIFTLGSEILFTIAVGFIGEAFPEFLESLSRLLVRTSKQLGQVIDDLSGADND